MEKCALCKGSLKKYKEKRDGVLIMGWKCTSCGESFLTANELLRWEIHSGKRKDNVRKIRKVGNSYTVTLPTSFVKADNISENDIAIFKKNKEGYLIQIIQG